MSIAVSTREDELELMVEESKTFYALAQALQQAGLADFIHSQTQLIIESQKHPKSGAKFRAAEDASHRITRAMQMVTGLGPQ